MPPRHRYGWKPDLPDPRDHTYAAPRPTADRPIPTSCTYLPLKLPPCYDQGQLGSCTGNGIALLASWRMLRQGLPLVMYSRLFIYWNERQLEGTINEDAGAEIRNGMKVLAALGVCSEKTWPYAVSKFRDRPSRAAFAEAAKRQAILYARVPLTLDAIRAALAFDASPIVFGFSVTESFESDAVAQTGQMPTPGPAERVLGGHCAVVVGYDDAHDNGPGEATGAFLVRNSWGARWGIADPARPELRGHWWFPYDVFFKPGMCDDLWVLTSAEGTPDPLPPPARPL